MTPRHPSESDRRWLTDQLAELIARSGWETFALAPLVRASDSFFPDRYVHGPAGVRTVARRILRHAGLDEVRVRVVDGRAPEAGRAGTLLQQTAIEFVSLADDLLVLELTELGAPEDVVPSVAHCVGRAYREQRALDRVAVAGPYRGEDEGSATDDETLEAQRATVAAVYLGFGILAANAAHQYRAAGSQDGYWARTEWVHGNIGGLDASAVSYLLALQLVVRDADAAYIASVVGALAPNQASDVREWSAILRPDAVAQRESLGLVGAPRDWPAEWEPHVEPIDDDELADADLEADEPEARQAEKWNHRRPVWRVRDTRAASGATLGALVGFALLVAAAFTGLPTSAMIVVVIVSVFGGLVIGGRVRCDFCSEPDCQALFDATHARCPRCGGRVVGEISSANKRLDAEEELEEQEAAHRLRDADGLVADDSAADEANEDDRGDAPRPD